LTIKVGVQLHPQATTIDALRAAWRRADAMGVDSIWTWDHFFPLYGDPEANHFECYSLLAAMAVETSNARFGALVSCNTYRNPDLLADMARTIDQLSGGRFILGIGAGWNERDYREYGYPFGTAAERARHLGESLSRIRARLAKLHPGPAGELPILVGAGGEKVTMRIAAEHADMWNWFGSPADWGRKNARLTDWCAKVGRDPAAIARTVAIDAKNAGRVAEYRAAGAEHVILMCGPPYDFEPLERMLAARAQV
jgi:probable F420-dependent oxidoreductase